MAKPIPPDEVQVEASFSRGMVRDIQRAQIPKGGVFNSVDFMLEQSGRAYRRGGWVNHSATLPAGPSWVGTLIPPTRVVAICNNVLFDVTSEVVPEAISVGFIGFSPEENQTFFVDKLIACDPQSINRPKKIYATGPAGDIAMDELDGSPPFAAHSAVYASRIVLGNGWDTDQTPDIDLPPPYQNRLWFSESPNELDTWDTKNKWIDVTHPITGLAAIQGALLVFSPHFCERILGGVPPAVTNPDGSSATDMELQPVGGVGCLDARSIVTVDNQVIFGSEEGIFTTNGVGFSNLMEDTDGNGILSYWRNLFVEHEVRNVSCGMLNRNFLFVSTTSSDGIFENFICYLPTRCWMRTKNTTADCFASGSTEQQTSELYAAMHESTYVARFSPILRPSSANTADGNNTVVEPVLETRMFGTGPGLKAYGFGRVTYDLRSSTGGTMKVSQSTGIEAESYTDVPESPLPATTQAQRSRFKLFRDSQSLFLKFAQVGRSDTTELFLAEVEHRAYGLPADGESTASTEYP